MLITSNEIRSKLKRRWPTLKYKSQIVLFDGKYFMPQFDDLHQVVSRAKNEMVDLEQKPNIAECNHFAMILNAKVIEQRMRQSDLGAIDKDDRYQWPIGICLGQKATLTNEIESHLFNFCFTTKGILFIEPKTGKIWKPKKGERQLLFAMI